MKNIEIEIRIKIQEPVYFQNWLHENAEMLGIFDQTDLYFDPPGRTFIYTDIDGSKNADEWFRIRIMPEGGEICYKHWHKDWKTNKSIYADEFETSVEEAGKVIEIFNRLGFRQTVVVKKHRESWKFGQFRFDCDEVEDLGFFVEIEFHGKIDDPAKGKEEIFGLLQKIGVKNWKKIKGGYPWMLWNKDKNYFEEV